MFHAGDEARLWTRPWTEIWTAQSSSWHLVQLDNDPQTSLPHKDEGQIIFADPVSMVCSKVGTETIFVQIIRQRSSLYKLKGKETEIQPGLEPGSSKLRLDALTTELLEL